MYTADKSKNGALLDLIKEYSPSKNSKRFLNVAEPSQAVIEQFLKSITEQTQRASTNYQVRRNVTYKKHCSNNADDSDNQLVDIYYRDKEFGTPIFVFIHGGYWQELDKSTSGSFVEPLVERGFRVIAVDYNLCPHVTLATINEQITHFFEWLYAYAEETQAGAISISGHSAGAYLAALLFNKTFLNYPCAERTVSFFLISGIFDLRECWKLSSVNPRNIWNVDETSSETLSPMFWELDAQFIEFAKEINLRIHILAAENDSETFKGQSEKYAKKLEGAGLQTEFKIFKGYDHFDIIENVPIEGSLINTYLLENLL